MQAFSRGWRIDLVADGVAISQAIARTAYEALAERGRVVQISWIDFLTRAKNAHEQFLDAHDKAQAASPATPDA